MNVRAVNEITISDLTDALTVILSSENYTFSGDENGAIVDSTCSITLAAYYGKTQCPKVYISEVTYPEEMEYEVENNNTANPSIIFRVMAPFLDTIQATISVSIDDVTISKVITFAVAKQGTMSEEQLQTVVTLQTDMDSIKAEVSNNKSEISTVKQTAKSLTARISNAEDDISSVEQTADKISWVVESGTSASSMVLTDNMIEAEKTYTLTTDENDIYVEPEVPVQKELTEEEIAQQKEVEFTSTKEQKINEMNISCKNFIEKGVEYEGKNYSYTLQDQSNLLNAMR